MLRRMCGWKRGFIVSVAAAFVLVVMLITQAVHKAQSVAEHHQLVQAIQNCGGWSHLTTVPELWSYSSDAGSFLYDLSRGDHNRIFRIDLRSPKAASLIPAISELDSLTWLDLRTSPLETAKWSATCKMPELQFLDLSDCGKIPTASLKWLRTSLDLKTLRLHGAAVDDGLAELLKNAIELEELDVSDTRLTNRGLSAIMQQCPKVWHVSIAGSAVDAQGIVAFCHGKKRNLHLSLAPRQLRDVAKLGGIVDRWVWCVTVVVDDLQRQPCDELDELDSIARRVFPRCGSINLSSVAAPDSSILGLQDVKQMNGCP